MKYKNRFFTVFIFLMTFCCNIVAQDNPDFDITAAGSGIQGTYLVQIYVYNKKGKVADDVLKRAAVRGVIFRGVPGFDHVPTQPAMASPDAEHAKLDFFNAFFADGGDYLNYANIIPGSYSIIKTAKKGYKVGAKVQILKDDLRRVLEKANVSHSLSNGF